MKRRSAMVFLGLSVLSGAVVVGSSMAGCQSSSTNTTGAGGGVGGGSSPASTGANSPSSTASTGQTSGTGGSTSSTTSTGSGTGGAPSVLTIQQLTDATAAGHVGAGTKNVEIDGVVVMSKKFLVSSSKTTGSCLWGVFVSAPGLTETAANTGLLIASYGTQASIPDGGGSTAYCPILGEVPAGDAIPDDVQLGDVLNVTGTADYYITKTCGTVSTDATVAQYQLSAVTKATKVTPASGPVALPTPHLLTAAQVAQLASPTDQAFHDAWGGVKVRIQNVTSTAQTLDGGASSITNQFGDMFMAPSNLQVGDKAYYVGALKSSNICDSGPVYADTTTTFTQIDGFSYLDFCTWDLLPGNRCSDLTPASDDCTGTTCP